MLAVVWLTAAAWNGWWSVPAWVLWIAIPAYGIGLYMVRDLFIGLWAMLIASKESFSWEHSDEVLSMSAVEWPA
jgi:hypothetical protein